MTTTYRQTYLKGSISAATGAFRAATRIFTETRAVVAPNDMEIRSSEGDIFRLRKGARFSVEQTVEGRQPVLSGEVYCVITTAWPKYMTTCWSCRMHSSPPLQLVIRPSDRKNTDEYYLIQGDMIIHDYDNKGMHYVISEVREGQKVLVTRRPRVGPGPKRYEAEVMGDISDKEYNYILTNFVDPRKWR